MRKPYPYPLFLVLGLLVALFVLPLGGCMEKQGKEEPATVGLKGYDHNTHKTEAETVTRFLVESEMFDGGLGGDIGGESCCIQLPVKWKPGMKVTVHWAYNNGPEYKDPPPQTAVAEIPEYLPEKMDRLDVHFYPEHKIKVVVTAWYLGSPFYPLPKEDWGRYPVDQNNIYNYKRAPKTFELRGPLTWLDLKWARQWGIESEDKEK
jgi:hypothetical protein